MISIYEFRAEFRRIFWFDISAIFSAKFLIHCSEFSIFRQKKYIPDNSKITEIILLLKTDKK